MSDFYHLTSDFFPSCKIYPIWIYDYNKTKVGSRILLIGEEGYQKLRGYLDKEEYCVIEGLTLRPFRTSIENNFWIEKPESYQLHLHEGTYKDMHFLDCKQNVRFLNNLTKKNKKHTWIYAYKYLSKYLLKLKGKIQTFVHDYRDQFRLAHRLSGFRQNLKDKNSAALYIAREPSYFMSQTKEFGFVARYWKSNTKHIRTCEDAFDVYGADDAIKQNIYELFLSKETVNRELLKSMSYAEE